MKRLSSLFASLAVVSSASLVAAETTRVSVRIENLAPQAGTFQTPFWVGFHEGTFDTYDGNTPASNDPQPGSVAMERLCEDGNTGPITDEFAALSSGSDATLPGPNGPIAPGEVASGNFILDSDNPDHRFFSYVSMVIPSNDFCISNGNPQAHEIFDEDGNFVAKSFFVTGAETLDAGTEVNDEVPGNTAFFGQAAPNTGVDENGAIGTIGSDLPEIGFLAAGSGGILDNPRFRMSDFGVPGYPYVKISFAAAPVITDDQDYSARLSGRNEVPPIPGNAFGFGFYKLREEGTRLEFRNFIALRNVTAAHLHLGAEGENGPIVASLLPADLSTLSRRERARIRSNISGSLGSGDLTGSLAGQPLDALVAEIQAGNVYVNIHTERFPAGAIRGQVELGN